MSAAGELACAVTDENRHEGGFVSNPFKRAGDRVHREILALCQMAAEIQFFGRAQLGDGQRLLNVQGAELAVRPHPAIVVDPVSDVAVVGTLITLLISAMCGYALAIYRFEIKYVNLVFGVFLLGTLIPGETLTIPQFSVISAMGLYNNIWGVILPVVTTTTGIFMYRQHYMSLPLSLVEAARIDGANEFQIFSHIMLPLGSNVTITLTIFSFMWRWNDYILPLLVLSDQKKYTIQIAIKNFIGNTGVDWSSILSASVLSILPIIVLFVILQKYIVGGVSAGGVKG